MGCIKNYGSCNGGAMEPNKNWIEQSSIYSTQYSKFYRWILYPTISLFVFIIIFLFFGKIEIIIRSEAQITTEGIVKIQMPIDGTIKTNNLKENLHVKENNVLITLDLDDLDLEKQHSEKENRSLDEQLGAINTALSSLDQEMNLFEQNDEYGYSNQVNSFLNEKESVKQSNIQVKKNNKESQNNYDNIQNQMDKQINNLNSQQSEWKKVKEAWTEQKDIQTISLDLLETYQLWQKQMQDINITEKDQFKLSILDTIDEKIAQMQQEIIKTQLEKAQNSKPINSDSEIKSQEAKIQQSKEQMITSIKQQKTEIIVSKEKNNQNINLLVKELANKEIKATTTGAVHLNKEFENLTKVTKGSLLAEIYPDNKEKVFETQIPADEISQIKKGQTVHFFLDKKGISEKYLDGIISGISETSTQIDNVTCFTVKGHFKGKRNTIKNGATGNLSVVIGRVTYFNYFKDMIFNRR